jgi:hypothetical protein
MLIILNMKLIAIKFISIILRIFKSIFSKIVSGSTKEDVTFFRVLVLDALHDNHQFYPIFNF